MTEEIVRGYHIGHKAYYKNIVTKPEVTFGHYIFVDGHGEGTTGEMNMEWENLSNGRLAPCLHVFDDSWKTLASFKDVIDKMAEVDDENISPDDFVILLSECGFKDLTKYERPNQE